MTTCTINFPVRPTGLEDDVSEGLKADFVTSWRLKAHEVTLQDLRPELECPEKAAPLMKQLENRGFAVLKNRSESLGPLNQATEWAPAYLNETTQMIKDQLDADDVFIWNATTRSSDLALQTPFGTDHFQTKPLPNGLQFGKTIRPTGSGAHVDQDASNSRRICRAAVGDDVFEKYSRVQQINVWRPIRGPVTSKPLAMCDGSTVPERCKGITNGIFGMRVNLIHDDAERWYYIKRQQPDECILLKIYDSDVLPDQAEFAPHTGVQDIHGADGPEQPRESIEIRLVACYR